MKSLWRLIVDAVTALVGLYFAFNSISVALGDWPALTPVKLEALVWLALALLVLILIEVRGWRRV